MRAFSYWDTCIRKGSPTPTTSRQVGPKWHRSSPDKSANKKTFPRQISNGVEWKIAMIIGHKYLWFLFERDISLAKWWPFLYASWQSEHYFSVLLFSFSIALRKRSSFFKRCISLYHFRVSLLLDVWSFHTAVFQHLLQCQKIADARSNRSLIQLPLQKIDYAPHGETRAERHHKSISLIPGLFSVCSFYDVPTLSLSRCGRSYSLPPERTIDTLIVGFRYCQTPLVVVSTTCKW